MTEYVRHLRERVGGDELLQVPSVSIALRDGEGRVLLARHSEADAWVLPGGAIEPGEVPADAAMREMWEETGVVVQLTGIVGVFGGPDFITRYRNGDRTSYVMTLFEALTSAGELRPDGVELLELRFVSHDAARQLPTSPWVPEALEAVFGARARGTFRPATWTPPAR